MAAVNDLSKIREVLIFLEVPQPFEFILAQEPSVLETPSEIFYQSSP
jgi:hypothetical protein